MTTPLPGKQGKARKRKARKALASLLARLRKGCDQFETVDDWVEFVTRWARPLAGRFPDVLPTSTLAAIRAADNLTETTRSAVAAACSVLTAELEKALLSLGGASGGAAVLSGGWTATLIGGGLLLLAGGAFVFFASGGGYNLTLANRGCSTIVFPPLTEILQQVPGVDVPVQLDPGTAETVASPLVFGRIEQVGNSLHVGALGLSYDIDLSNSVTSVTYDGAPMAGRGPIPLTPGDHIMVVTCE